MPIRRARVWFGHTGVTRTAEYFRSLSEQERNMVMAKVRKKVKKRVQKLIDGLSKFRSSGKKGPKGKKDKKRNKSKKL
jgi:hypothetical protein